MKRQQDIEQQARQAEKKLALYGADIDFAGFSEIQDGRDVGAATCIKGKTDERQGR